MEIDIRKIYLNIQGRVREEYDPESIMEKQQSLLDNGQLQDLLVRPFLKEEFPDIHGYDWVLVDGGRRSLAFLGLYKQGKTVPELPLWYVGAKIREGDYSELDLLRMEFHANRDRRDFTWKETGNYVRRMHEMLVQLAAERDEEWTPYQTSMYVKMGESTVYKYLQLTRDDDLLNDPEVQGATTFNTAVKKHQIIKERRARTSAGKTHTEALMREMGDVADEHELELKIHLMANSIYRNGDSRTFIRDPTWVPKDRELFDFIHWDPPFGGEQDGGAFTTHERIDDSWSYARDLHADMLPELFRTLKDGHWMMIWYHPAKYDYMLRLLQGHVADKVKDGRLYCGGCGVRWEELDMFKACPACKVGWWVNAYPFIWHKTDRMSDGHEIKRFRVNQYETFLLAAKWVDNEPILIDSSGGNVMGVPMVSRDVRRHVMHKPSGIIKWGLSMISVPGELGFDPGAGSGSSVEAALELRRRMLAVELSKNIWEDGLPFIKGVIRREGIIRVKHGENVPELIV